MDSIAILGTGLLGTSVGLALRAAGFQGEIIGWNRNLAHAETAARIGALDRIAGDPITAAREAQVVLISVPIYATLDLMEQLSTALGPEHLLTDVGSTKQSVLEDVAIHGPLEVHARRAVKACPTQALRLMR